MTREPLTDETPEQVDARRFVARHFPEVAEFLAEERGEPKPTEAEALAAYRKVFEEQQTHVVRLLDSPGATLTATCPDWCESDHAEDEKHGTFAADFAHRGAEEALHVDLGDGAAEDVLICEITQYPFGSDLRTPTVVMWPTLGMTEGHLDADGLCVLAEQLQEYADALTAMSIRLAEIRKQTTKARRADLKERWAR